MSLSTFKINPESASYAVADGMSFVGVQLDGGQSRFRKDKIGSARVVDVRWTFDRNEYLYFTSFYNTTIDEGSLSFKIYLILDDPIPVLHQVHFIQDSKKLSGQNGHSYQVSGQLEAIPVPIDDALNAARVAAYEVDPNTDLSQITVPTDSPPQSVGTIASQSNIQSDVVSFATSSYFSDPDSAGIVYSATYLPAGLTINSSTGLISGTITQTPTSLFATIIATGPTGFATQEFTWSVQVNNAPPP